MINRFKTMIKSENYKQEDFLDRNGIALILKIIADIRGGLDRFEEEFQDGRISSMAAVEGKLKTLINQALSTWVNLEVSAIGKMDGMKMEPKSLNADEDKVDVGS